MERIATSLLVSSFSYDHRYFESLFSRTKWNLLRAETAAEALEILRKRIVPVIIADERIDPGGWKGLLDEIRRLPYTPRLIVACLLATDALWADVLSCGGYDILARPFEQQEILHSISMGWLSWKETAERVRPLPPAKSSAAGLAYP
jgi:DNA-binding NtrC family response regulator